MSDDSQPEGAKILGDHAGVYVPTASAPEQLEPEVDFGGFIVGLYQSAMVALGEMEHPETGETLKDLETARHTIDILRMLHEKTRGNLDEEEDKLMRGLLYKLRVAFVDAQPR